MTPYQSPTRNSGIHSYKLGPRSVEVKFTNGQTYLYTHDSAGSGHVEAMRRLAQSGSGLSGYIRENRPGHAKR